MRLQQVSGGYEIQHQERAMNNSNSIHHDFLTNHINNISNLFRFSETYGHSLSITTQLSSTVDIAIQIVLHSAEVAHFTHKIREAFMSSTIQQYLKYSGEAPDHYLSLGDTNIGSTRWYTAFVYNHQDLGPLPFSLSHIHAGTNGVSGVL